MEKANAKQYIRVGEQQLVLPEGVTVAQWGLEKVTTQNPRIRAFLGCIKLLGGVLESNYAILHCSPERLHEIWRKVREVSKLIRNRIEPLLQTPSCIPDLEEARENAEMALKLLKDSILDDLEQFPQDVAPHRLMELRKLLCVSIGQLHSFLQDTFSQMAACDPRSGAHDADYFLSRRFSTDIEEAEWLHSTVNRLYKYLLHLEKVLPTNLSNVATRMVDERVLPDDSTWENVNTFLDLLTHALTPKIKEVLALRGIRFYEMEILDRYSLEIPVLCHSVIELYEISSEMVEKVQAKVGPTREQLEQCGKDLQVCHEIYCDRMAAHLGKLDKYLHDLMAFIPLWLRGIEKRRALMLKRSADSLGALEKADVVDATERLLT